MTQVVRKPVSEYDTNPYYIPPEHGYPLTYWTLRWSGEEEAWIATERRCDTRYPPCFYEPDGDEPETGNSLTLHRASNAHHAARLVRIHDPGAICYFWYAGALLGCSR